MAIPLYCPLHRPLPRQASMCAAEPHPTPNHCAVPPLPSQMRDMRAQQHSQDMFQPPPTHSTKQRACTPSLPSKHLDSAQPPAASPESRTATCATRHAPHNDRARQREPHDQSCLQSPPSACLRHRRLHPRPKLKATRAITHPSSHSIASAPAPHHALIPHTTHDRVIAWDTT